MISNEPRSSLDSLTMAVDYREPIAICGMAIRLPGNISSPEELWEFLVQGKDARGAVPQSRFSAGAFVDTLGRPGTATVDAGYFLDPTTVEPYDFDLAAFSMTKAEVADLDPIQRQLLEIVHECLASAGVTEWEGKDIGCFIGSFGEDWQDMNSKDTQAYGPYRVTGSSDFMLSNRISYEYDFQGPSITFRTACSASIVALHAAVQALRARDCVAAVVASANLILSPGLTTGLSDIGALASDASSKTFDANANGYARGEAVNAVYLMRLSDAIASGSPIRAVIRGTASNADGKTPSITNPNGKAQADLIRLAYYNAGLQFRDTTLVELHGTGTQAGDSTEANAVAEVFAGHNQSLFISSIKPNIGHSEGASGLTSIIKAVLALERKIIPPNIKFKIRNPKIQFDKAGLVVPTQPMPWPTARYERVSINSFGLGGANAHVILDSARYFVSSQEQLSNPAPTQHFRHHLILTSGHHAESASVNTISIANYIRTKRVKLDDLSFTLGLRRQHLRYRCFSVVHGREEIVIGKPAKVHELPQVVFVFTGQGAQYAGMAKALAEMHPSFDNDLRQLDTILSSIPEPPDWSIRDLIHNPTETAMAGVTSQPLCVAIQIGLVNLLRSWGIAPAAVIGHSSGEIAAAYASGALSMADAINLSYRRGISLPSRSDGSMAVVGLSKAEVEPFLLPEVTIACENSPLNVTISGTRPELKTVVEQIQKDKPQTFLRYLPVDMAYHSYHMESISNIYIQAVQELQYGPASVPMYSTTFGRKLRSNEILDAAYWRANLVQPVLFDTAMRSLLDDGDLPGHKVFVEIGPHSALRGTLRQCFQHSLRGNQATYIPTLVRDQSNDLSLLNTIGNLYCFGVPLALDAIFPRGRVLTDLPGYAWHREKVVKGNRVANSWKHRKFPRHELLGLPVLEQNELEPTWRNVFRLQDVLWIIDHQVDSNIVFPAAAYLAIAGEAIRQVSHGAIDGYDVRKVSVATAMILRDNKATEIMTSLKRARLSDAEVSMWYDFSVSSLHEGVWVQHCWGQVKASDQSLNTDSTSLSDVALPLPRKVSSEKWYRALIRTGLCYGPMFARIEQVTAAVDQCMAHSTISYDWPTGASYAVHPTALDAVFQTMAVASSRGKLTCISGLFVPTYLEELSVRRSTSAITIQADVRSLDANAGSTFYGSAVGIDNDNIAIRGRGLRMSRLPNDNEDSWALEHKISGAEMVWMPSLKFLSSQDKRSLISTTHNVLSVQIVLEKIALLTMNHFVESLSLAKGRKPHLEKFRQWMISTVEAISSSQHPVWPGLELTSSASDLVAIDQNDFERKIASLRDEIGRNDPSSAGAGAADAIKLISQHLLDIVNDKVSALELLSENDAFGQYYRFGELFDYRSFLKHFIHERPTCNILELGAGTGSTTATILPILQSDNGNRLFSTYTFTDISEGFLSSAKNKFLNYSGLTYKVFDINKDPTEQGIQTEFYDLVIASNVVHATPNLSSSLANIRKTMKSNGYLLMQELCSDAFYTSFVMGGLEGWWLGESDNRTVRPYMKPEEWATALHAAGFAPPDITVCDHQDWHLNASLNALMVTNPSIQPGSTTLSRAGITILINSNHTSIIREIKEVFSVENCTVEFCYFDKGQMPMMNHAIISLLDLDGPFLLSISSEDFRRLTSILTNIDPQTRLIWCTQASQFPGTRQDPSYAPILGLARNSRFELGIDFVTIETDLTVPSSVIEILPSFCNKYRPRSTTDIEAAKMTTDYEFGVTNGTIYIGRYDWYRLGSKVVSTDCAISTEGRKLAIARKGALQTLMWEKITLPPISNHDVKMKVTHVGLNFRDIMVAMGVITAGDLGLEAVGTVVEVGSAVTKFQPGDRVVTLSPGCFGTDLSISDRYCVRVPDSLGFEDAATMYSVFCTSVLALLDIGKLRKGQSILIHSACGGIGLAAIQLCQFIGVEIFATVGSDVKVKFLQDEFGIPSDHIFNSRSNCFRDMLLAKTSYRGVDVVLNSLAGELLQASWDCVAEFGILIELGKRDIQNRGRLDMSNFSHNRGYYAVDYEHILTTKPSMSEEIMERVTELYSSGAITALPSKMFPAVQVEQCFRAHQKGEHIGKIVLEMPEDSAILPLAPTPTHDIVSFDPAAGYLLVGGLGGIGRSVAVWMAERGAKHLIFVSHSKDTVTAKLTYPNFFEELEALGAACSVHHKDISVTGAIEDVIKATNVRIKGILQLAMELNDNNLMSMTYEQWQATIRPKITGTLNIHHAFATDGMAPLDFFVMFGSHNGLHGWYGQSNYLAANAFVDAFVDFRNRQGMAASVLDIGPIEDVGFVNERPDVASKMRSTFKYFLPERRLLEAIEIAIAMPASARSVPSLCGRELRSNPNQIIAGLRPSVSPSEISSSNSNYPWQGDSRFLAYQNIEADLRANADADPGAVSLSDAEAAAAESSLNLLLSLCSQDASILHGSQPPTIPISPAGEKTALQILAEAIFSKICNFLALSAAQKKDLTRQSACSSLRLSSLGVDSLVAIELRSWWRQRLRLEISVLELLDYDSIGKLAEQALVGLATRFPI